MFKLVQRSGRVRRPIARRRDGRMSYRYWADVLACYYLGQRGYVTPGFYLFTYICKKTYQFKTLCKDDVIISVH